jgi:ABC-type multidrug transport system fused ATPase/permease subunit
VYGIPHISKNQVEGLIYDLGLADVFSKMTDGIDTMVGKYGSKVSGGQRQIIWLLRTILQNPDIILMDEPTSSIDEKTKEVVQHLCNVLMKDKTVIMVTHDAFLTQFADRIIHMRHGEVVDDQLSSSSSSPSS